MSNKKLCIVIPIYMEKLNDTEKSSIDSYFAYFTTYDIFFVHPKKMNIEWYRGKFPKGQFKEFDDAYFHSNKTYNKMMFNVDFYNAFNTYEYMLIAQQDARIVNPQIDIQFFLDQDVDYIGAPWLKSPIDRDDGFVKYIIKRAVIHDSMVGKVGNGGFSLRRISAIVDLLERTKIYRKIIWHFNEDLYISYVGMKKGIRFASFEVAKQFALEQYIKENFREGKIPLAVHAWEKTYDNLNEMLFEVNANK